MLTIAHVGPVTKQKDGKQIVNNAGVPCAYFTVGFAAPFQRVRLRNMWGELKPDGTIVWDRIGPNKAQDLLKRGVDVEAEYGVRFAVRELEPFTPEGLENEITAARLIVFPDETEKQALARLYGADARFKSDTDRLDENARPVNLTEALGSLEANGVH